MSNPLFRTLRANRGLLIMIAAVLVMGAVHSLAIHQRAFLNLYFLPVVLGAYSLGRRKSVFLALLSILIAGMVLFVDQRTHFGTPSESTMRWLDLGTWGGILLLTAYLVGSLSEQKQRRLAEIHRAHAAVLEIMIKFIDSVDRDTKTHSSRVADYSVEVARTMGLSDVDVEDIRIAAWLHDVGKMESSMEVLRKAAGPTPKDIEEARRYEGAEAAEKLDRSKEGILTQVISIVSSHHERWDGAGSRRLLGDEIPVGARIIAVANTFDTIVSDAPYHTSKSHAEAIKAIQLESGQGLDPQVVDVFLSHRALHTEKLTVLPRTHVHAAPDRVAAAVINGSERLDTEKVWSMNGDQT
jgi:putative nucleotidyltransferase with HDIG domain